MRSDNPSLPVHQLPPDALTKGYLFSLFAFEPASTSSTTGAAAAAEAGGKVGV